MGRFAKDCQQSASIEKQKKDEALLIEEFGFSFDDTDTDQEDIEETVYIWETHFTLLDIYQTALLYPTSKEYILNSQLIIELLKEEQLSIRENLTKIANIHSGYLSKTIPTRDTPNP